MVSGEHTSRPRLKYITPINHEAQDVLIEYKMHTIL
jgi:hypothetical protein